MSKILKGFVQIDSLQSMTPGIISPLGELSIWSLTYTKDKTEFGDPSTPGYRLVATSYLNESGTRIEPDQDLVTEIINLVKSTFTYVSTHSFPIDDQDFHASIVASNYNTVNSLRFGPLISNGSVMLPEWLEWSSLGTPGTLVKIWLADEAFASQYDLYDIVVIPPLSNIDDFFLPPTTVYEKLNAITSSQMMDTIQNAKQRNPETFIRTETFNYISPRYSDSPRATDWTVLIYGLQGDNIDAIKDAIVNYVLAHSTHTREEWEIKLPDLFKRTEFVILPRWENIAIPDLATQSGLYSVIQSPQDILEYCVTHVDFYTREWMLSLGKIVTIPAVYKCIALDIVTGPKNNESSLSLKQIFPDYVPISTTSLDFNRMSLKTQDWVLLLEKMLIVAENFEKYTTIPEPLRIIYRGNRKYLSAYYKNVNYIMALKSTPSVLPAIA